MSSVAFSVLDVFSKTPYKGNPLAIVDGTSQDLTTAQQQLITRQFNLSETTFFFLPTKTSATYKLRSFLPDGKEVFGAGHNILGAWYHLAAAGLLNFDEETVNKKHEDGTQEFQYHQELGGDVIPVRITRRTSSQGKHHIQVKLRQAPPQLHGIHPQPAALARSFGLAETDIGFPASLSGKALPPQVASTATTHHLLVPLASIEALNKVVVQRDLLLEQLALVDERAYGLFLFARTGGNRYKARFFSPGMSGEDPATGSAAGPLSVYLHEHGEIQLESDSASIEVRQGLQVGRDCLIQVRLSYVDADAGAAAGKVPQVDLIGGAVSVSQGHIALPDVSTSFN